MDLLSYFDGYLWLVKLCVVISFVFLIDFLRRHLFRILIKKGQKTSAYWHDAMLEAVRDPLGILVWLIGLYIVVHVIAIEFGGFDLSVVNLIFKLVIIAVFAWFLIKLIGLVEKNLIFHKQSRGDVDITAIDIFAKLLRLLVILTFLLILLQTTGYGISGVLTLGGIGGAVLGFAAKDVLANFFGGIVIYVDRPFKIGDWIRSPDREIEGVVEYIGWRVTQIRTFDKRPLYVPNSVFTSVAVENPSRMTNRRIFETIGIRYADVGKMNIIVSDVKKMLQEHEDIDVSNTLIVNFNEFAPSSLDFFIYTFTKTTDWIRFHEIKQDVLLQVISIIELHGAECAFPTSTLHVADPIKVQS